MASCASAPPAAPAWLAVLAEAWLATRAAGTLRLRPAGMIRFRPGMIRPVGMPLYPMGMPFRPPMRNSAGWLPTPTATHRTTLMRGPWASSPICAVNASPPRSRPRSAQPGRTVSPASVAPAGALPSPVRTAGRWRTAARAPGGPAAAARQRAAGGNSSSRSGSWRSGTACTSGNPLATSPLPRCGT